MFGMTLKCRIYVLRTTSEKAYICEMSDKQQPRPKADLDFCSSTGLTCIGRRRTYVEAYLQLRSYLKQWTPQREDAMSSSLLG